MQRKTRRIVAAVAVIALLAAGGAAFTASITGAGTTNNTAAYDGITVNGAVLSDAVYSFDGTGANITGVTFTFTGDLTGDEVKAGFGSASNTDCGAVTAGDVSGGNTTISCSFSPNEPTQSASTLNVLVSNN
jgi:hypothetical protein